MDQPDKALESIVDEHLESSLDSVDATEERVKEIAKRLGIAEEESYQLGYAVREAMVNAVVHGNGYSANKRVHLTVGSTGTQMSVMIEDEGQGFAADEQADPLAEENLLNQSGRGIMIIRAFVDEFKIEKTGHGGTRIVMKKAIPAGT